MAETAAPRRHFASDNLAGAHPEVLAALAAANAAGHLPAYGADPWTARAEALLRRELGAQVAPFLVHNGTSANVLALATVLRPHHAVLCADTAHIHVDECGAPERFAGVKLLPIPTPDGKLTPDLVRPCLRGFGVVHHSQPGAISITQTSEYGTAYTPEEVRALADLAHAHGLLLHMDGARLANAAATLGLPLGACSIDAGVDLLAVGLTKNGALGAEALVFADAARAAEFGFVRKQGMQLASKMRFLAAQAVALLEDGLWLRSARHANAMAARLAERVRGVPGVRITQRVEANVVFAVIPARWVAPLQAHAQFYVWNEATGEVRWMTAWDTTAEDVDRFADAIAAVARELPA